MLLDPVEDELSSLIGVVRPYPGVRARVDEHPLLLEGVVRGRDHLHQVLDVGDLQRLAHDPGVEDRRNHPVPAAEESEHRDVEPGHRCEGVEVVVALLASYARNARTLLERVFEHYVEGAHTNDGVP